MKKIKWWPEFFRIVFKMNIKATINYFGWNVITENVINAGVYALEYILIWATMSKFTSMNGWNVYEVTFIYSLCLLSYALGNIFIRPFWYFDDLIVKGGLDDYLIRPVNPLAHLLTREWQFNYLGHFIIGIPVLAYVMGRIDVFWSSSKIFMLVLTIIGGAFIQAAIVVIPSCTAFWIVRSSSIASMLRGFREVINYPVSIYPKFIQILFTFILPYAMVNYYPSLTLLNKSTDAIFSIMPYITLFLGVVLLVIAYLIWNKGLKSYNSSGS